MRLALVQTNPQLGTVQSNIERASTLLSQLPQHQLDLIILPELAFSGYNFTSAKHILPYVETSSSSPSRDWARKVAKEYNAKVLIGLPTQDEDRHNTASLVDETGEVMHEYHKTHMFDTDYKWGCTSGPGFSYFPLTFKNALSTGTIRTTIGICMDLNPWEFIAHPSAYEFATYIIQNDIVLVLIPMAWLLPPEYEDEYSGISEPTLTYWVKRLYPLVEDARSRIVVICNRTGQEEGARYAGTSCVLRIGGGDVTVLGVLGRMEGVLSLDVEV
jgi:protein N-terminal amidase